jgi:hypothetical protein
LIESIRAEGNQMSQLLQYVRRRRKPLVVEARVCPHCGRREDEPVHADSQQAEPVKMINSNKTRDTAPKV